MSTRDILGSTGVWETETSATAMLVLGSWFVLDSFASETPSAPESVLTLVSAVLLLAGSLLAVAVVGRFVSIPVPRERAATAAAVLGFGVVLLNGALAAHSVLGTDGAGTLLAGVAVIGVAVVGILGGLVALGYVAGE